MNIDWSHEESYRGLNPLAAFHRNRLIFILNQFNNLDLKHGGHLADFGCSNGYILSLLQRGRFSGLGWQFSGFDYLDSLLEQARKKNLPDTTIAHFDLNSKPLEGNNQYDIVCCFETLEHTGDYMKGLRNLVNACKPGGYLIVSVPNEVGLPGLIKYLGRKAMRRNAYRNFFLGKSEGAYFWALCTGAPIERFRVPPASGWGPHLGFDYREMESFIDQQYLKSGLLKTIRWEHTMLNFNRVYIFKRPSA
ncbi:MAG: class I SAM-dependent methyltransferase [Candidatus Neomarinimicrobiota bacterium]